MATKKLALTDSIVCGQGVTTKNGVTADRNISIGDNSGGYILLESGDRILQEDNLSGILQDIPEIND